MKKQNETLSQGKETFSQEETLSSSEYQPILRGKSVLIENTDADDGIVDGIETPVTAQITLPSEDCWAWLVLVTSFFCLFIVHGCAYSYGALLPDIVKSLQINPSLAALIGSIEISVFHFVSPLCSGLINRFGFRNPCLAGGIISSVSLFMAHLCKDASLLMIFLALTGAGISLSNLTATLIVGFYFEKRRALALAISSGGGSVGLTALYQLSNIFVKSTGWKNTILMHAGLNGIVYFLGLTFRPLLSLTITEIEEDGNPTQAVTILPTINTQQGKDGTATEKILRAYSNKRFPTASAFVREGSSTPPSVDLNTLSRSQKQISKSRSKVSFQAHGTLDKSQMKLMQSMTSKIQLQGNTSVVSVQASQRAHKSFWKRLFNWRSHSKMARPMYRDDIFYTGSLKKLPAYQKSVLVIEEKDRTGYEYQLAVTRAIRTKDLQDRRRLCPIALRRVLVSMLDFSLLKRKSVVLICVSGVLSYSGVFVPIVFLQDRNTEAGIDAKHCSIFVSVIACSSLFARFIFSWLTDYIDVCYLITFGSIVAGIFSVISSLSYSLFYQYMYSVVYGSCIAAYFGCRSFMLLKLYGLENLTNATGVLLMFLGIGNLISTPIAAAFKKSLGYEYTFYASGIFLILSGVTLLPVNSLVAKEKNINN